MNDGNKTYLTSMGLHNIDSIDLNSVTLGNDIKSRFESIDSNFDKILKSEYLRGHAGSNMATFSCEFTALKEEKWENVYCVLKHQTTKIVAKTINGETVNETVNETVYEKTYLSTSLLVNIMRDALAQKYYQTSLEELLLSGKQDEINWISKTFTKSSIIHFITENDGLGNRFIKTSLPYHFTDPDLISNYKGLYNGNNTQLTTFEDKSCVLYFDTTNDYLETKIYNGAPTIYYDSNIKDFCWKINEERTGISAKGIPGERGKTGSSFLLGLFYYDDSDESKKLDGYNELNYIYAVTNDGVNEGACWYNMAKAEEVDELSKLINLDHGSPIIAFGVYKPTTETEQTTEEYTTKLYLGLLQVDIENSPNKYYITYTSKNGGLNDIGDIISRADFFQSLNNSEALFLNIRNKQNELDVIEVEGKDHFLCHYIKPELNNETNHNVLTIGASIYAKQQLGDHLAEVAIMGSNNDFYMGDGLPDNHQSTLNIKYKNTICNNLTANGDVINNNNLTTKGNITIGTPTKNVNNSGNLITQGDIHTNGVHVSSDSEFNGFVDIQNSAKVLNDLSVSGNIKSGADSRFINVLGGIYVKNEVGNPSTYDYAVQMWKPSDNYRYNVRFNDAYVFLQDSFLQVTGISGQNGNGIHSKHNIISNDKLIAGKDGVLSYIANNEAKLLGNVTIGNNPKDVHNITGSVNVNNEAKFSSNLTVEGDLEVKGTVKFINSTTANNTTVSNIINNAVEFKNTMTVGGNATFKQLLKVKGDTELDGLLNVGDDLTVSGNSNISGNTVLGNSSSHKHVINGEISITHWIATDEMIEKLFD